MATLNQSTTSRVGALSLFGGYAEAQAMALTDLVKGFTRLSIKCVLSEGIGDWQAR